MENNSLLDVQHLSHMFHLKRKMTVKAIDDVSFQIKKGEIYGLVGESGSGKSTVARCIMNIYKPSEGEIFYKGIPICKNKEFRKNRKMLQMTRQMIFQDSASSLNPRMKIEDIVAEPLRIYSGKGRPGKKEIEKHCFLNGYSGVRQLSRRSRILISISFSFNLGSMSFCLRDSCADAQYKRDQGPGFSAADG